MIELVKELNAWAGLLSVVGIAMVSIAMLYLRSVFAPRSDLELEVAARDEAAKKVVDRVEKLERAVDRLEQRAATAPTQTDLQNIVISIESFRGDVKAMASEVTGLDRELRQIGRKVDMLVENEIKGAQSQRVST
ncbi:DUF2730 family protein [Thalassobaculum sp. OXR-137]|uniref:DUF2730 family protein n=1 Tax=Thalassobaculum sp. OXR-137 TaxID=3100173 RepID=UPI002AC95FFC|nr:DUF2730 family protein [Thalassobaculum sp. OXR-137]WPZ33212.1 DUF2730 family protein [Thalassobaculum sp. OXR-137]WPZ34895.1 DUF2730 family protein [Thalassobaculum sp. OXR-137]